MKPEDWKPVAISNTVAMHRTGWLGVWDQTKAFITRQPRRYVNKKITINLLIRGEVDMAHITASIEDLRT